MMCVRAVCLVIAAILVSARVPLLWLWLPLCFVGMLVVPWLAVIWANDRLPKARLRIGGKLPKQAEDPKALSAAEAPRVIDADERPAGPYPARARPLPRRRRRPG